MGVLNSNNIEKLSVYPKNTVWLKLYMYLFLYLFVIAKIVLLCDVMLGEESWAQILAFLRHGEVGFYAFYWLFGIVLLLAAALNAVLLPSLNIHAFRSVFVFNIALALYYPLTYVLAIIFAAVPSQYVTVFWIVYPITLAFSAFNTAYFARRDDLFKEDVVKLVTGQEKDEIVTFYDRKDKK